jgi:deoxyribonuclease-1
VNVRRALAWLCVCWLACVTPTEERILAPETAPRTPLPPSSFERAKRLAVQLYADHRTTLYCGCEYAEDRTVRADTCGYTPRIEGRRARRFEWEHIVPAHSFGSHRACWVDKPCRDRAGRAFGGRRCCRKRDAEFRRMEADLQNLTPEIGELNADRSHFGFGEVEGEPRLYGACDFEVSRTTHTAEPPPSVRGDVARAYLYMWRAYGPSALPLPASDLARFERWHRADPPTEWERTRDERITRIQGVSNPWIQE